VGAAAKLPDPMPRVLIVRGHLVTPWELRPWMELPDEYDVRCLLTGSNQFSAPDGLRYLSVGSRRDLLPSGMAGELAMAVIGDRYRDADEAFAWADIVHAEELSFWFSADAARRRRRRGGGFALVQTVWETLPMLSAFRNRQARRNRDLVLAESDLFLPTTERAAMALRLEGVDEARIRVCPPGIDTARFATRAAANPAGLSAAATTTAAPQHILISPGRLVWEKGHQDVLRALALLHRGTVTGPDGEVLRPRLQIIGSGPEEGRLRAYADELGLRAAVSIGGVAYDEMPARFAAASAMLLGSQSVATAAYHPFAIPRVFWEEQFGLVLAEAMASGLDIIATTSGAIPEVLAGTPAQLVAPADWPAMAAALATGPLARAPGARVRYPEEVVRRYSTGAAAQRLAAAYEAVLG
jgi:glycosyltransferase involved in cell wall biosynthesis